MAVIGAQTIESLLADLYKERGAKYKAGLRPLQKAAGLYGPGYMAGQEHLALTAAKSALGARGLGGTTRPMAVSAGMKAGFEDVRRQGLADALARISQYIGGTAPEAGTLAHLATGGFSGLLQEKGLALRATEAGIPYGGTMAQPIRTTGGTYGGAGDIGGGTLARPTIGRISGAQQQFGGIIPGVGKIGTTTGETVAQPTVIPGGYGPMYQSEQEMTGVQAARVGQPATAPVATTGTAGGGGGAGGWGESGAGWTQVRTYTGPDGRPITEWRSPTGQTVKARSGQRPGIDFAA